ncbi:acyl-CoA dehydrogenase family protein [Curtobacterium flaccumfaciens]|nr:acyl-CoA dehydrogenase family protein [Curtobacterium flaccumfaciens]
MTDATTTAGTAPSLPSGPAGRLADLRAHFGPLFDRIREGAVERELASGTPGDRPLPHGEVRALADAGFGRLRVPEGLGGFGVTLVELAHLVTDLAAADSNIAHLWRGHFGYTELVLLRPDSDSRDEWLQRIVEGAIVGNATSERTGTTLADISTTVTPAGPGSVRLDGTKYYSTGTLYADWIYLAADRDGERVTFAVPGTAPGVTGIDDWDGFGQRLTASGTTVFDGVPVDPSVISAYRDAPLSHIQAFYQLYLLAVLAGIGQAVVDDAVAFVRPRTRTYIHANAARPAMIPRCWRSSAGCPRGPSPPGRSSSLRQDCSTGSSTRTSRGSAWTTGCWTPPRTRSTRRRSRSGRGSSGPARSCSRWGSVGGRPDPRARPALAERPGRGVAQPGRVQGTARGGVRAARAGPVDAWEKYHEVGPTRF